MGRAAPAAPRAASYDAALSGPAASKIDFFSVNSDVKITTEEEHIKKISQIKKRENGRKKKKPRQCKNILGQ